MPTMPAIKAGRKIYFLELMCYLLMQRRAVIGANKPAGPFDRFDCRKTKTEQLMSSIRKHWELQVPSLEPAGLQLYILTMNRENGIND